MIASSERPASRPKYCSSVSGPSVACEEPLVDREEQGLVVGERPVEVEQQCCRRSPSGAEAYSARAMPPLAFTLALAAAVLHAFWNILLARARDPESATAVALLASVVVFAPVTALRFDAEWAVWPFIVVTSMLQLLYFALLATAYRKAELSFVYPVARGVAPAIVLVVSVVAARARDLAGAGRRRRPRRRRRAARPRPAAARRNRTRCGSPSGSAA